MAKGYKRGMMCVEKSLGCQIIKETPDDDTNRGVLSVVGMVMWNNLFEYLDQHEQLNLLSFKFILPLKGFV